MNNLVIAPALVAALIHVWFFAMESIWFMRPSVYHRFGLASDADARAVRSWAYNQGFYNLFLAAGVVIGLALGAMGDPASGRAIVLFACASMVAAGLVLFSHNRALARAAAIQVLPPVIAIAALVLL